MEKCVSHKCMIIFKESNFILLLKMSGIIFYVIYMFTITFNTILLLINIYYICCISVCSHFQLKKKSHLSFV